MTSYLSSLLNNVKKIYKLPYSYLKNYLYLENKNTFSKEDEDFIIIEKEDKLLDVINYYLNDVYPTPKVLSCFKGSKDDNLLLKMYVENYENQERQHYLTDSYLYKYFLSEKKETFNLTELIEKNKAKTDEFRYYGLYFIFGSNNQKLYEIYFELFPNVNKFFGYGLNFKEALFNLKNLNKFPEIVLIIPCTFFPLLINELNKMPQIKYIILNCHGKHVHKEKYLKSFSKYKGIFITHEKLLIILNNINKQYKLPKFNYNFEEKIENEAFKKPQENENILNSKDGYKKFNFKTNSNIISNIDNDFKDYYEKYYFIYDFSINFFNTINQLILKIYFLYKNIDNKQLKRNEKYKSYIDFISNKFSENEQIEQCKEFIPKLYLVCYYYHCYPYYYPFKLNKKIVNEIIKVSKSEYKKNKKNYFFH